MAEAAEAAPRALVTPEGVDLRLRLGAVAERACALLIDLAIIGGALFALTLFAIFALGAANNSQAGEYVAIIWLLGFFLARNFYFTGFECGPRAATPGKRLMGLRVAARNGGALNANSIVARNAMRELELYLPTMMMFQRGRELGAVIVLCGVLWCAIFLFFPLFNRDRLRVGDVLAGTWVVKTPKRTLLPDLASERAARDIRFAFTDAQLDVYGVKELQVLEQVLRGAQPDAIRAVGERIRAKIDWPRTGIDSEYEFLSVYYAALRRRLEQRLLLGVRKRDKHDPV